MIVSINHHKLRRESTSFQNTLQLMDSMQRHPNLMHEWIRHGLGLQPHIYNLYINVHVRNLIHVNYNRQRSRSMPAPILGKEAKVLVQVDSALFHSVKIFGENESTSKILHRLPNKRGDCDKRDNIDCQIERVSRTMKRHSKVRLCIIT